MTTLNPPRNVRALLYLVATVGTPLTLWATAEGWLDTATTVLVGTLLTIVSGLAVANTTPPVKRDQRGATDAVTVLIVVVLVLLALFLLGVLRRENLGCCPCRCRPSRTPRPSSEVAGCSCVFGPYVGVEQALTFTLDRGLRAEMLPYAAHHATAPTAAPPPDQQPTHQAEPTTPPPPDETSAPTSPTTRGHETHVQPHTGTGSQRGSDTCARGRSAWGDGRRRHRQGQLS